MGILLTTALGGVNPGSTVGALDPNTIDTLDGNPVKGPLPVNAELKYFPTSCPTRITPSFLNSIVSEMMCVVARAGNAYNGNSLCNLSTAIENIIDYKISEAAIVPVGTVVQPGGIV